MESDSSSLLEALHTAANLKLGKKGIFRAVDISTARTLEELAKHSTAIVTNEDARGRDEMLQSIATFTEKNLLIERQRVIDAGIEFVDAGRIIALSKNRASDANLDAKSVVYVGTPKSLALQLIQDQGFTGLCGGGLDEETLVEGIGDEKTDQLLYSIKFEVLEKEAAPVLDRVAILEANHLIAAANLHEALPDQKSGEGVDFYLGDGIPCIGDTFHEETNARCENYKVMTRDLNRYILSELPPKKMGDFLALGPETYPGETPEDTPEEVITGFLNAANLEQRLFLVNEALEAKLVNIAPSDITAWKESVTPQWFDIERSIARKLVVLDKQSHEEGSGFAATRLPEVNLDF